MGQMTSETGMLQYGGSLMPQQSTPVNLLSIISFALDVSVATVQSVPVQLHEDH